MQSGFLTSDDLHYFNEGKFAKIYEKLGAHILSDQAGVHFVVWAPNASYVSVIGDFNFWKKGASPLSKIGHSGLWAGVIEDARKGQAYKYHIVTSQGVSLEKADPVAFCSETPPKTASVIWDLAYEWNDAEWMRSRGVTQSHDKPMSIYEVHLGSWKRVSEDGGRPLSYEEHAEHLTKYVLENGYTHVELMPVMEHPFGGSWGYQVTGYYAPTRRYGNPQHLMYLIDKMHQAGIGVILDWVPSHFPDDPHGLAKFDGTYLYEHADPQKGYHPDWKSCIFNFDRHEVRNFLIGSAMLWLDKYHVDSLRVDAVASMLYLDYSRKHGEWEPNIHGGRENLGALQFIRELNETAYKYHPDIQIIAEESTSWPKVSRPIYDGGLGFGMKWDMGWMNDTLRYFSRDPVYRSYHQNDLTFRSVYAFHENFVLSLSHDEVVHGKGSLLRKMPGDEWQRFANLRCLFTYMYALPGKKLLFMGGDIAQDAEWNHDKSLDWHLLDHAPHRGIQAAVKDLNFLYKTQPALWLDCDPKGFEWIDAGDHGKSVFSFLRKSRDEIELMLCVFNMTPEPQSNYRIGVPREGVWEEVFNADSSFYGGSGIGNLGEVISDPVPQHGRSSSLALNLPPLSGSFFLWKK